MADCNPKDVLGDVRAATPRTAVELYLFRITQVSCGSSSHPQYLS